MRNQESRIWKEDTLKNAIGSLHWGACADCSNADIVDICEQVDMLHEGNCGKVEPIVDGSDVSCANFTQTDMPPESMDRED